MNEDFFDYEEEDTSAIYEDEDISGKKFHRTCNIKKWTSLSQYHPCINYRVIVIRLSGEKGIGMDTFIASLTKYGFWKISMCGDKGYGNMYTKINSFTDYWMSTPYPDDNFIDNHRKKIVKRREKINSKNKVAVHLLAG